MIPHRVFILLVVLVFSGCKAVGNDDSADDGQIDPVIAEQIELCEHMCLKPFCDPTLEPAPGVETECANRCSGTVADAQSDECTEQYQGFLECLDALSCDDFYRWIQMQPDAPCAMEEEELSVSCPGVKVRNESP